MSEDRSWWYAVNDRPVKLVTGPDGTMDALVLDWETGAFVSDRSYVARVSEVGVGKDVDQLSVEQFEQLVVLLRRPIVARHIEMPLPWVSTGDGEVPYRAVVGGRTYELRVNDFPEEPMYTLLAEGDELADLEDWPSAWTRPREGVAGVVLDLHSLAVRLCAVVEGDEAQMVEIVGPTDPPPFGAQHCRLRPGAIATVELQYDPPTLARSQLEAVFGAGEVLPRTGPGASHVLCYGVRPEGTPSTVSVFARFAGDPQPGSPVRTLLMRIDPRRP